MKVTIELDGHPIDIVVEDKGTQQHLLRMARENRLMADPEKRALFERMNAILLHQQGQVRAISAEMMQMVDSVELFSPSEPVPKLQQEAGR